MGGGGCGDDDTEEKDVKNLASGVLVTDSFRFCRFVLFLSQQLQLLLLLSTGPETVSYRLEPV